MPDPILVTVRDSVLYEMASDEQLMTLFFPKRQITARELICERVRQEVTAYNHHLPDVFQGLVAPSDAERVINGFRLPRQHTIDAEAQCKRACEAFEQNGFILLLDDSQVETLDEPIVLQSNSSVVFLKLMPLVGG